MGCTNYTTKRDASTALSNSGYINWRLTADQDHDYMTPEQEEEIKSIMWKHDLCPGHGVKRWLMEHGEQMECFDGLPDGDECSEEDE